MNEEHLIFSSEDVTTKIKRLSFQILEDLLSESEIHFIGIKDGGLSLAHLIAKEVEKIKQIPTHIHSITINKSKPLAAPIELSIDATVLQNKVVVLVDDVSNTGRTLFYALQPLLTIQPKALKVAVLVDRQHKKFPIHCDYVGNSLSTTMKEHIDVTFENKKVAGVYLS